MNSRHLTGVLAAVTAAISSPLYATGYAGLPTNESWAPSIDLNGDGYADLLIGEPYYDSVSPAPGMFHVVSTSNPSDDYTVIGEQNNDFFGYIVRATDDLSGDGLPDILVSAAGYQTVSGTVGKIYAYRGNDGSLLWTSVGQNDGGNFGASLIGIGDVNGDGFADVAVGATYGGTDYQGTVQVLSGANGNELYELQGDRRRDYFGTSIARTIDVDGDSIDDFLVGAPGHDAGGSDTGRVFLCSGATGAELATFTGNSSFGDFGFAVDGDDTDNDGLLNVVVGAPNVTPSGGGTLPSDPPGAAYIFDAVVLGTDNPVINSSHTLAPSVQDDYNFGLIVVVGKDVDDDFTPEILVGASNQLAAGSHTGRLYVYDGDSGAEEESFIPDATALPDPSDAPIITCQHVCGADYCECIGMARWNYKKRMDSLNTHIFWSLVGCGIACMVPVPLNPVMCYGCIGAVSYYWMTEGQQIRDDFILDWSDCWYDHSTCGGTPPPPPWYL